MTTMTYENRVIPYIEAEKEALQYLLAEDERFLVIGEGINDDIGEFGITTDLYKEYGTDRLIDPPLAENGISGIAVGAAMYGMHVLFMNNRPDFLMLCMDQIVNHAAKFRYMSGGQVSVPLVMWAATGKGWGSAAQHSQAIQGMLLNIPGLKIVMPSSPYTAKGLLLSAVEDGNPVIVLEHRDCMRQEGQVPESIYHFPIGKAMRKHVGTDVTIIAVSAMNLLVESLLDDFDSQGISIDYIDLLSVKPYDKDLLLESVRKTGRAVIADTGNVTGSVAKEISDFLYHECFGILKARIEIVALPDTPVPAGYTLENAFYRSRNDIWQAVLKVYRNESC